MFIAAMGMSTPTLNDMQVSISKLIAARWSSDQRSSSKRSRASRTIPRRMGWTSRAPTIAAVKYTITTSPNGLLNMLVNAILGSIVPTPPHAQSNSLSILVHSDTANSQSMPKLRARYRSASKSRRNPLEIKSYIICPTETRIRKLTYQVKVNERSIFSLPVTILAINSLATAAESSARKVTNVLTTSFFTS